MSILRKKTKKKKMKQNIKTDRENDKTILFIQYNSPPVDLHVANADETLTTVAVLIRI